jgi:hypothetical protein
MLFNHIEWRHFILDEVFDVEEQNILVLVQIVDANGTLETMLVSRKSDGAGRAIIVVASRWPGLLVFLFLLLVILLVRLLLDHLLLAASFLKKGISLAIMASLLTCESEYI